MIIVIKSIKIILILLYNYLIREVEYSFFFLIYLVSVLGEVYLKARSR